MALLRSRPMVVAFVEVESPQMRLMRYGMAVPGTADADQMIADARRPPWVDRSRFENEPAFAFWCAADEPPTDEGFRVAPVYRTTKVPDNARCAECGIGIRELQAELTRSLA